MTDLVWEKPAPGTWELDRGHQVSPYGRYTDDLLVEPTKRGFAEGFADAGIPLATIEPRIVNGWMYTCVRPLGGPAEGGAPPPAFVMRLLFFLVPELRRRAKRAAAYVRERRWTDGWRTWFEVERPAMCDRLDALPTVTPSSLSDEALCDALAEVSRLIRDLTVSHFRVVPASAVPIGDYLVHSRSWGNVTETEAMRALAGYTDATQHPVEALQHIARALKDANAEALLDDDDPRRVLERIAELGGDVAAQLNAYLRTYGPRVSTDGSVFGKRLDEMPDVVVESLRRAGTSDGEHAARVRADAAAATIRACIDARHRDAWDTMLETARAASECREDGNGILFHALGIARQLLLEIGRRFVDRGLATEAESAFDLTETELIAVMRGRGLDKAAIDAHTAHRRRCAAVHAPNRLGPEGVPPPIEIFPDPVRRIVEAMFAFASRLNADADPIRGDGLVGHGVSPGVVTGRATVVRRSEDFARFRSGDILVAQMTSSAFNAILAAASAVVTETGGLVCHAAIVARELGIPGIVGVANVLDAVPDGAQIRVDGDRGTVEILSVGVSADDAVPIASEVVSKAAPRATVPEGAGRIVELVDAHDPTVFGGKAAALARLIRAGLPVPPGIALDVDAAQGTAADVDAFVRRVRTALADLEGPFAVRSSATVEDANGASYAGQFETVLGVSVDEVANAVREVWASGSNDGVRAYRARLGLTEPVRMAVVVQQLVPAESAGVLFYDLERPPHVVEAAWGLGEVVVDGSVSPDRYEIDGSGRLERLEIGDKRIMSSHDGRGRVRRDVPTERARIRCLDDQCLVQVADLGAQTCRLFGDARDIEWAFADGRIYCLQARPITRNLRKER